MKTVEEITEEHLLVGCERMLDELAGGCVDQEQLRLEAAAFLQAL